MSIQSSRKDIFSLALTIYIETGCRYLDSINKALAIRNMTWEDLKNLCIEH